MTRSADNVRRHLPEIMELWAVEAKKAASARGLSRPELRNLMPKLLEVLASRKHEPAELRNYIEGHLASRLRQGFDLAEMVEEFAIMERVAASVWDSLPEKEQPSHDQRAQISSCLRDSAIVVTEMFQEHMQLDEQSEKRYLRELQSIADDALRAPTAPYDVQLADMLAIVMDAMGAQCAAAFIYEPDTQRLITSTATGHAEDSLEELLTAIDHPSSFVRKIAEAEQTTAVLDAETTELTVTESLRHSGIHALLGVALRPHSRLVGVMYVGLREQRAFSPREVRRLEALADRMSLHLDNAHLYRELREHVAELDIERNLRENVVAMLAHDLRGPLTTAQLGAQRLMEGPQKIGEQTDLVVRMKRSLDRVDRMIRDLLDVSRLRAGEGLPLHLEECSLALIAQEAVAELRSVHGDRFELVRDDDVRGFWSGDELRRAVWNLGVNAVKYGAPETTITVRVEKGAGCARLSVHNAGDAISPEDQARLFDAYTRASVSATGTAWGLGLALVRACAEAHGGQAQVRSTPEEGTTMIIELPLDSRPYQKSSSTGSAIDDTGRR